MVIEKLHSPRLDPRMCLQRHLEELLDRLHPSESLVLTRQTLPWYVERAGRCACADHETGRTGAQTLAAPPVYSTNALARELNEAPSTMRDHIANGLCGNPTRLKRSENAPYKIPGSVVREVREMCDKGLALGTFCVLRHDLTSSPEETGGAESDSTPDGALTKERSPTGSATTPVTDDVGADMPVVAPPPPRHTRQRARTNSSAPAGHTRHGEDDDRADLGAWRRVPKPWRKRGGR